MTTSGSYTCTRRAQFWRQSTQPWAARLTIPPTLTVESGSRSHPSCTPAPAPLPVTNCDTPSVSLPAQAQVEGQGDGVAGGERHHGACGGEDRSGRQPRPWVAGTEVDAAAGTVVDSTAPVANAPAVTAAAGALQPRRRRRSRIGRSHSSKEATDTPKVAATRTRQQRDTAQTRVRMVDGEEQRPVVQVQAVGDAPRVDETPKRAHPAHGRPGQRHHRGDDRGHRQRHEEEPTFVEEGVLAVEGRTGPEHEGGSGQPDHSDDSSHRPLAPRPPWTAAATWALTPTPPGTTPPTASGHACRCRSTDGRARRPRRTSSPWPMPRRPRLRLPPTPAPDVRSGAARRDRSAATRRSTAPRPPRTTCAGAETGPPRARSTPGSRR